MLNIPLPPRTTYAPWTTTTTTTTTTTAAKQQQQQQQQTATTTMTTTKVVQRTQLNHFKITIICIVMYAKIPKTSWIYVNIGIYLNTVLMRCVLYVSGVRGMQFPNLSWQRISRQSVTTAWKYIAVNTATALLPHSERTMYETTTAITRTAHTPTCAHSNCLPCSTNSRGNFSLG